MFKKIISSILAICIFGATVSAHPFTDTQGHWADEEIGYAYENKIVNGYGDGLFKPQGTVTRAEFVKMLMSVIGETLEIDVTQVEDNSHWAAPYYRFAIESGLFLTDDSASYDGVYPAILEGENYNTPIKRWEMAYMLFTTMVVLLGQYPEAGEYNDQQATLDSYGEMIDVAISGCIGFGLITGDQNGNFNPAKQGTRAEAVTIVNRVDRFIKNIIEETNKKREEAENEINAKVMTYVEIPSGKPKVLVEMSNGKKFKIELYPEMAPQTVANFVALVESGFYNGLTFHRVIEGFMAQGGDPEGDGTGGAAHTITGEFAENGFTNLLSHQRGVISMARSEFNNSASSQFFICYGDCSFLDGNYAAFGKVIEGMDVVDSFIDGGLEMSETGELSVPKEDIVMKKVTMVK